MSNRTTTKRETKIDAVHGIYVIFDTIGDEQAGIKPFDIVYIGKDSAIDRRERYRAHFENETHRDAQAINRAIWKEKDNAKLNGEIQRRYLYDTLFKFELKDKELSSFMMDLMERVLVEFWKPKFNNVFNKKNNESENQNINNDSIDDFINQGD